MSSLKITKSLTYEEIGEKLNISPQQVHKIEKDAFNKIIKRYMISESKNIFEAVILVSQYFGMDPGNLFKKLDGKNYQLMCDYVKEEYGRELDGYIKTEDSFLNLFV